jgi:hypothetical protein
LISKHTPTTPCSRVVFYNKGFGNILGKNREGKEKEGKEIFHAGDKN